MSDMFLQQSKRGRCDDNDAAAAAAAAAVSDCDWYGSSTSSSSCGFEMERQQQRRRRYYNDVDEDEEEKKLDNDNCSMNGIGEGGEGQRQKRYRSGAGVGADYYYTKLLHNYSKSGNECVDEMMDFICRESSRHEQHQQHGNSILLTSWLGPVQGMSETGYEYSGNSNFANSAEDTTMGMMLVSSSSDESEAEDETTALASSRQLHCQQQRQQQQWKALLVKEEIRQLTSQLIQVKRRLGPAAERAAAAALSTTSSSLTQQTCFQEARNACNPMEWLNQVGRSYNNNCNYYSNRNGRRLFMNRSAINLANIDAILNFSLLRKNLNRSLTKVQQAQQQDMDYGALYHPLGEHSNSNNHSHHHQDEDCFTFVDLCGGPGGFSEYLFHRFHLQQQEQQEYLSHDNDSTLLCDGSSSFSSSSLPSGPSSYSSYLRGYGMSLVGSNEHGEGLPWKLRPFQTDRAQFRICTGVDGTGDIYEWRNVRALQQMIYDDSLAWYTTHRSHHNNDGSRTAIPPAAAHTSDNMHLMENDATSPRTSTCLDSFNENQQEQEPHQEHDEELGKVDLVVADGGMDVQRDADDQEGIAQKLVVCQIGAALALLREGGTLVVKLFGFQTDTVRTVLHDVLDSFHDVTAIKPISSRPASAERYVVATGFRGPPPSSSSSSSSSNDCWNAARWHNRALLGLRSATSISSTIQQQQQDADHYQKMHDRFDQYLDQFDRDMLALNSKACFSILSHLENKARRRVHAAAGMMDASTTTTTSMLSLQQQDQDDDYVHDECDTEEHEWHHYHFSSNNRNSNRGSQQWKAYGPLIESYKYAWKLV